MSMTRFIAKFEKVSKEEFAKHFDPDAIAKAPDKFDEVYNNIKLPKRATVGSAGYDFFLPVPIINLGPGDSMIVPTGIKVSIEPGWALFAMPKSGLGFKYRLQLDNTIGLIDSDYYNNEKNEGHILFRITNDLKESRSLAFNRITNKPEFIPESIINMEPGKGFVQGVFLPYGVAEEELVEGVRTGGFGSTEQK